MKKVVLNLDKLHLILIGIIMVGVGLFLINRENSTPSHLYNPYKNQLDSLSLIIDNYKVANDSLNIKYHKLVELSLKYSHEIDSLNIDIKNTRKRYEKQIKNLNNSSPTELYEFITSRYK